MTTPHEAVAKAVSGELPHAVPGVTNLDRRVATAAIEALRDEAMIRIKRTHRKKNEGITPGGFDDESLTYAEILDAILGPKAEQ